MKKTIAIAIILILSLSFVFAGCGGGADDIATPDTGSTVGGTDTTGGDTDVSDATDAGEGEPQEGYLDEATGIWHTSISDTDVEISFSVPDGWWAQDGLPMGGGACYIWPPEEVDTNDVPGVIIDYNRSNEDAQAVYDSHNEDGSLGESQEMTYGSNVYVTNVVPTAGEDGETFFYYTGKSDPVVYIRTTINDANQAALEEVLSTLTY